MATHTAKTVDTTQHTLLNVNMTNVKKLTSRNYLMWSLQVHALLDGYDLSGYLDGTTPPPAATNMLNDVTMINPAFTKWKRQEKLIYSGLLAQGRTYVLTNGSRAHYSFLIFLKTP